MQQKQLFTCIITGLNTSYDIPMLPNKAVEYISPIAQANVAIQYATLSHKELNSLPSTVLAAIFLSLSNKIHLLEDRLDASTRNKVLVMLPAYDLIQAIKFVASLIENKELRKNIPSYSIEMPEGYTQESVTKSFQGYIKTLRENLSGTYYNNNPEANRTAYDDETEATILRVKKSSLQNIKSYKEAYKLHISILSNHESFKQSKAFAVLKVIGQNNNLAEASLDIRTKLIQHLLTWISTEESKSMRDAMESLIRILKSTTPSSLSESKLDRVSDEAESAPQRKSLKDILAAKKSQSIEVEASTPDIMEDEEVEEGDNDE